MPPTTRPHADRPPGPARATALKRAHDGRLVSAKSRTGRPECSAAMSAFNLLNRGKSSSMPREEVSKVLARCRSLAHQQRSAANHAGADRAAMSQHIAHRAAKGFTSGKLTVKERAAEALKLVEERRAKNAARVERKAPAPAATSSPVMSGPPAVTSGPRPAVSAPRSVLVPKPPKAERRASNVQYVRAPAGGAKSEVTGQFYAGGRMMPIHGLFAGQEKAKGLGGTGFARQAKGTEKGKEREPRLPAKPLTAEEVAARRQAAEEQAKWDDIRSGPLSEVGWIGDRVGYARGPRGDTWQKWVEKVGPERLAKVEKVARAEAERQLPAGANADDLQWMRENADDYARRTVEMGIIKKKHAAKFPASSITRNLISDIVESRDTDAIHRLHRAMSGH